MRGRLISPFISVTARNVSVYYFRSTMLRERLPYIVLGSGISGSREITLRMLVTACKIRVRYANRSGISLDSLNGRA